jgi:hypothetical protein
MRKMQVDGIERDMPPEIEATLPRAEIAAPPASVTNYQGRAVLRARFLPDGRSMLTAINETLQAGREATKDLPENDERRIAADLAWQAWEQANTLDRDSALVASFAERFGLDAATLDDLFREAAAISA